MNIFKKSLSVFLALLLLFSVIPMTVLAAAPFAGGSGSEDNPYQISTPAQLNKIRNYTNSHFILINDIIFSESDFEQGGAFYNFGYGWEPIAQFYGSINGNGYAIENLYVYNLCDDIAYSGLIGINLGNVHNLNMYNCYILGYGNPAAYSGAIAGVNKGTISNCYSSNWIYSLYSPTSYAGGICGSNEGTVVLCFNLSMVDSESDTIGDNYSSGGITGLANSNSITTYCVNYGYVYGKFAGGIAGQANGAQILLCRNDGEINEEIEDFDTLYSGGIVGYSSENSLISGCINTGTITASSSVNLAYAGGIAAHNDNSSISDSYNLGAVTSKSTAANAKYSFAGGIAGYNTCISSNTAYQETIVAVYNMGEVSAKASKSSTTKYAGGIAGNSSGVVKYAYYLNNITKGLSNNSADTDGTKKLTDSQMKLKSSYEGFDLEDMWWLSSKSGYDYPQLTLLSHNPATSIKITKQPANNVFFVGNAPDLSGGEMIVTYANGASETLDTGELSVLLYDETVAGKQTISAVYANATLEMEIIYINETPDEIILSSLPTKLNYVQGQPLNISGAVLSAVYGDAFTTELDISEAEFSYDTAAVGEVEVTVTHSGLSTSFTINVSEKVISSIEIDSVPENIVYKKGSQLLLSGAILKAIFQSEDNYFELTELTAEMVSGFDMNTTGKQTVTVSYKDKTAFFDIYIVEGDPGDVNGDGKKDTTDLAALKLYLAGVGDDNIVKQPGYADCNCDQVINTADLAWLKLSLANS